MKHLLTIVLALLVCATLATTYPLTIIDDLGRTVTLDTEPLRIVSMAPSHTETICALEACSKLVGVDQFSNYPEEVINLPVMGNPFSPDIEQIIAMEPELVLVDDFSGIAETLSEFGIPVFAGTAQTFEEVFEKFTVIGMLVNREVQAAQLTQRVQRDLTTITELTADRPAPRVYYELDVTQYTVGPESFIGVLLTKAKGMNIVPVGLGDFPRLDPEFIVMADPEVIILSDAPHGVTADLVAARPGWTAITAVKAGAIHELTTAQVDTIDRPGPRMGEALELLARLLHPDLF